jgi:hypothetical protein
MRLTVDRGRDWQANLAVLHAVIKQIPFAFYKTTNKLILEMQRNQRWHQERVFEIRQKGYWHRAVKITKFPKKRDWEARMQIVPPENKNKFRDYAIFFRQEEGGKRSPLGGRKHLAIPTQDSEVDRTVKGIIKKKDRPSGLRGKGDFTIPAKRGGGRLLFQRIRASRKYASFHEPRSSRAGHRKISLREDPNIRYLYYLAPSAQIDPVYDYYLNAEKWWDERWLEVFEQELRRAMKDAGDYWRKKGGG